MVTFVFLMNYSGLILYSIMGLLCYVAFAIGCGAFAVLKPNDFK